MENKKKEWTIKPEDVPTKALQESSLRCYKNATDILKDAQLLYENGRYARASALAILAEEELAKAFILNICAFQKRWDSVIWGALTSHGTKQAISEGMQQVVDQIDKQIKNDKMIADMNRRSLISTIGPNYVNQDSINKITADVKKKHMIKKSRDAFKQDKLYISLDKNCLVSNDPAITSQTDAEDCINHTKQFSSIVEHAYEELGIKYSD